MTGKRYYLTTLGAWQRHAADFSNSHFLSLDAAPLESSTALAEAAPIVALIEADEGVHLALEDDAGFEALPHPLANQPLSDAALAPLAPLGVAPGTTTFDAAEILSRVHPLLRHRVF